MIESIHLQNWQCHENLLVEFDPKVTVLVGGNGAGKTAVLRALCWVFFNEWEGGKDEHITWGAQESVVQVMVDAHRIVRRKGVSNSYEMDVQSFTAFGVTVPQDVARVLSISRDAIQGQHDPAFWLSLSSGQAASALNEIFCLTAIDNILGNVAADLRQARARAAVCEERASAAIKTRAELAWVSDANVQLKELEEKWCELQAISSELDQLESYRIILAESQTLEKKQLRRLSSLEKVILAGEEILLLDQEIASLEELVALEDKACRKAKTLKAKKAKLDKLLEGTCPLCGRSTS